MQNLTVQGAAFGVSTQCVSGFVTLFRFIQPPRPGEVIGTIRTIGGAVINLIQTVPTSPSLASVDGQFATLCGRFVAVAGRSALDVTLVIPSGVPVPTPFPINNQLLLLLLILLLSGGLGTAGLTGAGLSAALSQLGVSGNVNLSTLLSQAAAAGINVSALAGQLPGSI